MPWSLAQHSLCLLLGSGLPVISVGSSDWCAVRHLGQEVVPSHDGLLYLRSNPLHEDQPLVSLCKGKVLGFICEVDELSP